MTVVSVDLYSEALEHHMKLEDPNFGESYFSDQLFFNFHSKLILEYGY